MIRVANAPCSYGVFDESFDREPDAADPVAILDQVARAGYDGIDLGPRRFLGEGVVLRRRLERRGLSLAGGYLELPLDDPVGMAACAPAIEALLDALGSASDPDAPARPTVAACATPARGARPGRAAVDRSLGWDSAAWKRVAGAVGEVVARCRARGFEPTFHPHGGTHVEAVWEIERLLELTDIGLCLDTGHLAVGGGDALTALRDWGERINHVHLKDVRADVLGCIFDAGLSMAEVWRHGAFCELGAGDVPVAAVAGALVDVGYRGWVVVEQDVLPQDARRRAAAPRAQAANRSVLASYGI